MECIGVEMSVRTTKNEAPNGPEIPLHPCTECGGPMQLVSVTHALKYEIKLRKTYQCIVCESIEILVAPTFD
jgi:hypothetical protein